MVDYVHYPRKLWTMSTKTDQSSDVSLALLIDRFMRRIHTGLQQKAPAFDTENVGPGGGMVLLTLAEMGETEMGELSRRVARDKSQMTRMIRSLEKKELIYRRASALDARSVIVSLTPEGHQFVGIVQRTVAETIDELLGAASTEERAQLRSVLERVLD